MTKSDNEMTIPMVCIRSSSKDSLTGRDSVGVSSHGCTVTWQVSRSRQQHPVDDFGAWLKGLEDAAEGRLVWGHPYLVDKPLYLDHGTIIGSLQLYS